MTCKDCIHYEVCKKTRIMNPSHNYATECNDYNDRSRFVELPFKSRSHYYRIFSEIDGYVIATIFQSINAYHDREEAEQALKERIENDA